MYSDKHLHEIPQLYKHIRIYRRLLSLHMNTDIDTYILKSMYFYKHTKMYKITYILVHLHTHFRCLFRKDKASQACRSLSLSRCLCGKYSDEPFQTITTNTCDASTEWKQTQALCIPIIKRKLHSEMFSQRTTTIFGGCFIELKI